MGNPQDYQGDGREEGKLKWHFGLKHTKAKIMMMYTIVKMPFGIAHVQYVDGAPETRV
jgi:hypothetical protein